VTPKKIKLMIFLEEKWPKVAMFERKKTEISNKFQLVAKTYQES